MIVFGAVSCLKPGRNLNIAPKEKEAAKKFNETTEKLKEAAGSEKRSGSDLSFLLFAACIFAFAVGLVNVRQISFVINHFSVNELGYSITESLWGLGLMVGCFVVVILDRRWQTSRLLGRSYLLIGFCILGLFLTHFYFLGLAFYLLLGIGNMAISIILTTLVQKKSPGICIGKSLGKKNLCQQISNLAAMGFAGIFETTISSDYIYLSAGILLIIFGMTMLVRFEQRLA